MTRVLGIVTARGGSKGIPRKNIRLLGGKPLIEHTARAALGAKRLSRVILSTDDEEIADVGRRCGLEVPFLRPADLALDETPTLPVLQHALKWIESANQYYDYVCLLQPTAPLRRSGDIDACVDRLLLSGADSLVTVMPVPAKFNPHWVYFRDSEGCLRISTGELEPIARRQALPPAYARDGSVYLVRRGVLMEQNSLYGSRVEGLLIDSARSVNLDSPEDWERAESLLAGSESC